MTGVRGAQGACAADSGRPGPATPDRPCGTAGGDTAAQDGAVSTTATVVPELFAGPGGWSTALRLAGYVSRSVGVEYDPAACATARAAGHERVLADVADVDPVAFAAGRHVPGLIGSPPCTTFSNAGHGAGRRLVEMLGEAITHAARGEFDRDRVLRRCARVLFRVAPGGDGPAGHRAPVAARWRWAREQAVMAVLVVEPMRWIHALDPGWVALEQVPSVLPLWTHMAAVLRGLGYSAGAWVLSAEEYGVPQTRKRAILLASRHGRVLRPTPTHQPYRAGRAPQVEPDLFGDPLPPPVSMAAALGWDRADLVGFPRRADTDDVVTVDGVEYRARDLRAADQPAQGVTEKARSWERWPSLRVNDTANGTERDADEPAPTVFCSRPGNLRWLAPAGKTSTMIDPRPDSDPSHTITGKGTATWGQDRPSTTVQGDARVWPPGHKVNAGDRARLGDEEAADRYGDRAGTEAVRVTVAEAGVLQSFPADYPWQGTKTAQYRQVGDAVPPLLGAACLAAVIPAAELAAVVAA